MSDEDIKRTTREDLAYGRIKQALTSEFYGQQSIYSMYTDALPIIKDDLAIIKSILDDWKEMKGKQTK